MNLNLSSRFLSLILLIVAFVLSACDAQQPPASTPEISHDDGGTTSSNDAYPATSGYPGIDTTESPSSMPYPPPPSEPQGGDRGPRFIITPPYASDNVVTGTAPRNLELAIVDVTLAGIILGIGESNSDGEFSINVSELRGGHRIGITVFDRTTTMEDIAVEYYEYRGDGFYNVPNVGVFMDTVQVNP